jgi:LacI family transcriptional regulator
MKHETGSVGILISLHTNPYFIDIINSIERVLARQGTYIYLCNCENNLALEREYTQELLRRNIDALMVIETPSLNTQDNYFLNNKFSCSVILINQHLEPYGDNYVIRCDQTQGINAVFEYVKENKIFPFLLFMCSEDNYSYNLKEELFKKWRRKNGYTEKKARIIKARELLDANNEKAVWKTYKIAREILGAPRRPRAILAGNELMAMGILTAARDLSIPVPGELTVIGVDNTYLSRISCPPLSTVDLRMNDVGTLAAELYLEIKNKPEKEHPRIQVIPSRFIRRGIPEPFPG